MSFCLGEAAGDAISAQGTACENHSFGGEVLFAELILRRILGHEDSL
jgi:hypothetical protein